MGTSSTSKQSLQKYHEAVHNVFAAYGSIVAAHPFVPILFGTLLLGSLCIGIMRAEKEANIENLWVEQNSRVVPEKKFFDSHFGGISRKETVAITSNQSFHESLQDLGLAMDALTSAIKPLYDELVLNYSTDGYKSIELTQSDFCERPLVPQTLKRGVDPNIQGNWYAWGYRRIAKCAISTIQVFLGLNLSAYHLPEDWGIDVLPCLKLSPMDCFQEGKNFDYPEALKQLDQLVIINETLNGTLTQLVAGFEQLSNHQCFSSFELALKKNPQSIGVTIDLSPEDVNDILAGVKTVINVFAGWGYNWRPSYKSMTNEQIMEHFTKAMEFSMNTSLGLNNPAVQHCITEKRPCCLTWFGATAPVEASLGGVKYDESGKISAITSLRWGANNWNQKHPLWMEYIAKRLNTTLTDEKRENLILDWEKTMIEATTPLRSKLPGTNFSSGATFQDFQLEFTMWRSSEDILLDANRVPLWQIILSAVLVFSYAFACFVNFKSPVHSHTWVVLMGMVVVSFAIVSGFGLTSALGIKLSPLAGSVVPFLALGLGIDDVFVLVNTLRNCLSKETFDMDSANTQVPFKEMRFTVSLAGPSVVLTTLTILASFFISSVNPMPIVRWFCWQMGLTALIHTFGMILIFIPLLSLDARRVKAGIVDPCLWVFCGMKRRKTGKSSLSACKDMQYSADIDETVQTPVSRLVSKFYAPLFGYNIFKITLVFLFACLLGATTYLGFWKVEHGLKLSDIALKGSYQHDYAALNELLYPQYDLYLVTEDIKDYSSAQTQLYDVYDRPQQNLSQFLPSPVKILDYTWLGNLYTGVNMSSNLGFPLPQENFSDLAQSWSTSLLGIMSLQDLYCQSSITGEQLSCFAEKKRKDWSIGATKTVVFTNSGSDTRSNVEMIEQTRKSLDNLNKEYFNGSKAVYMYGYPFLFNEQYLHSTHDLYMVVGFALLGVLLAVSIFQFSLRVSLIITIVLLMVDIEVYGFMYIIGAKLNALSLVNLGIVIGMASEFTYLTRSFLLFDGTKNQRVQKALEWTFEPLLHGLGTQIVATLPLLFLKFHAFRVYYFAMFTIMGVFGFLNGFVLLPVILSWIGPSSIVKFEEHVQNASNGDKELEVQTFPNAKD
ncbi:hypothetical protein KP509_01G097400 [Ceratopteris richardii]|uniref:SSD domain-containing protein n=1 Tax=Ceratopteris richardii TaxID=49495 RepID=A0A8T2VS23_CERRI|nr:hypothetical protein KP509_01G097400 [Ceratopteris richardii]KAH7447217.1 hypothetical protein KP509_01G097400 [Ceratopteris richardii]KAH7447218.1 hypothetical protein KP509_01G097400 [Ceratopteris richardii]KAH7447219.1 hypothetical protein KP509_01G097400 [Ceratopteris richardii]KAH7447220.1 hypothetical protein KP509_01G097400 [Ceratopteris richardii]